MIMQESFSHEIASYMQVEDSINTFLSVRIVQSVFYDDVIFSYQSAKIIDAKFCYIEMIEVGSKFEGEIGNCARRSG